MRVEYISHLCLSTTFILSVLGDSTFSKVSTNGGEQVIAVHSNFRSRLQCAVLCEKDRNKECSGFLFDSVTEECKLFQGTIATVENTGHFIYKKNYYCPGIGFQQIEVRGLYFCYSFISTTMNYGTARAHCQNLGAYLLHFDHLNEYDAVQSIATGTGYGWIGANDLQNEGQWISEKDGLPIDTDLWLWNINEPTNSGGIEHCGTVLYNLKRMNDLGCASLISSVCEKDIFEFQ